MKKKDLIGRWQHIPAFQTVMKGLTGLFSPRGRVVFVSPGSETIDGRSDSRGFRTNGSPIASVEFIGVDFTFSSFAGSRIENSVFLNCRFVNADFSGVNDHSNRFQDCEFIDSKFVGAAIGFDGTKYSSCHFERCNFSKSNYSRAEFTDVSFVNCRLKDIDFYGSSFANCEFVGVLTDVWFRGGYPLASDITEFGFARRNSMQNVSFENAELSDLTFSDHCDLSTVKLSPSGKDILLNNWKKRLDRLKSEIVNWEEEEKQEAEIFAKVGLVRAPKQDWYIVTKSDVERRYGKEIGAKIVASISAELAE